MKSVTVSQSCAGGFRMQGSNLSVYPNPTKGQMKVQIPIEFRKNGIIQVANQFGVVVLVKKVPTGATAIDIDISRFWNGIYQVTLKSGKNVLQTKIIKQ
ncbi:MAG: T9SS type A sorting domain-containing protein [Bacteroidota bacterium]